MLNNEVFQNSSQVVSSSTDNNTHKNINIKRVLLIVLAVVVVSFVVLIVSKHTGIKNFRINSTTESLAKLQPLKMIATPNPTKYPTSIPTLKPTKAPILTPTKQPTKSPISKPTKQPTNNPTSKPTFGFTALTNLNQISFTENVFVGIIDTDNNDSIVYAFWYLNYCYSSPIANSGSMTLSRDSSLQLIGTYYEDCTNNLSFETYTGTNNLYVQATDSGRYYYYYLLLTDNQTPVAFLSDMLYYFKNGGGQVAASFFTSTPQKINV